MRGLALLVSGALLAGPPVIRVSAKLPDGRVLNLRAQPPAVVLEIQGRWFPDKYLKDGVRDGQDYPRAEFHQLTAEGKRWALRALFPRDRREAETWIHEVAYRGETMAWLGALLLSQLPADQALGVVRESNPELREPLKVGQRLRIPKVMVDADLQEGWDA